MERLWLPECGASLRWLDLPGAEPPLVVLHCLGGAASGYVATVCQPSLAARRRLLIDLLGYGCSDRPIGFGYTLAEQAATVATLLDRLGIARATVVGHSMGGSVAIVLAVQRPDLVGQLLVDEPPLELAEGSASRAIAAWDEATFVATGFDRFVAELREEAMTDVTSATFLGMFAIAAPHAVYRTAVSMVATTPSLLNRLIALTGPRAYIWGERMLNESLQAARMNERLQREGVPTVTVAGSGHHPNLDNPAGFAAVIASTTLDFAPGEPAGTFISYRSAK